MNPRYEPRHTGTGDNYVVRDRNTGSESKLTGMLVASLLLPADASQWSQDEAARAFESGEIETA